ncbi:F-box associated domain type 1 [Arabidopsis suecica]|uniref:F-box associated domain type 1 n=1 Tax=Arabidopsis suecica TaxID=45249 RepID=A0A8T2B921_ARASU|nr:F-box associated domain type 1 [Arabidopsis suecica]
MTMMSDLSKDLVEEILSKAPITSLGAVRSTSKQWNASSKDRLLCKAEPREQYLRFMVMDHRFLSMTFNLHGILKGDGEVFVRSSIKEVGDIVNQIDISKVFHCDGLVLCVTNDNSSLVVWNPYLGQTKWIEAREPHDESDLFALGYDKDKNHKILRLYDEYYNYKFYNLKTESWGEEDYLPGWDIDSYNRGVALNGNTYFLTQEQRAKDKYRVYLLCFDFTTETFGEFLAMPFRYHRKYIGTLSCVGKEKLAALYQRWDTGEMAIWVTTKIESNEVLWSNLFKVDMKPLIRFGFQYCRDEAGSFFFDEEKKLAVVFNLDRKSDKMTKKKHCYHTAYIVGVKGYLRKVVLGEAVEVREGVYRSALVCSSSYVPSLEKINQIEEEEQKGTSLDGNTYFWTRERKKGYDSDEDEDEDTSPYFLICFDFTAERFGKLLDLPFTLDFVSEDNEILYCVKEEKLAALYQQCDTTMIEIWITTKIEPNAVSWTPFLKVDIEPLLGLDFLFNEDDSCFFIDEEKKLAVVIHADGFVEGKIFCERTTSLIIGENGYLKKVNLGEETYDHPLVCSYVPSSVQINQIAGREGRENKRKRKSKGKDLTNKV